MKKLIPTLAALLAAAPALLAQQNLFSIGAAAPPAAREVLDTTRMIVSYRMHYQRRPNIALEDAMLLEAGRRLSKYYSYKTCQADSLLRATPPELVLAHPGNFRGGEQDIILQNPDENTLTHIDKLARDYVLYTEPLPEFGWEAVEGERTIVGYACRRAICRFRGRNYEAWYAEEIPASLGPWKFRGLPGLILAVSDDAGILCIEATGIVQREQPITLDEHNYLKTDRKKYRSLKQRLMTDPIGYLMSNTDMRVTFKNADGTAVSPEQHLREFTPIELE